MDVLHPGAFSKMSFGIVSSKEHDEKRRWSRVFAAAGWRVVSLLYGVRHWHSWHRQTARHRQTDRQADSVDLDFFHVCEISWAFLGP